MKLRIFSWLSSICIAAALGWFCRGLRVGEDSRKGQHSSQTTQAVRVGGAAGETRTGKVSVPASTGDYRQLLQAALATKDPYAKVMRVLEQLEHTDSSNVEELRSSWRQYLSSGMPKYGLDYFVNRSVAKALGANLLKERSGRQLDFAALGAVGEEIEGAMLSDPEGVRRWYDSLKNERFRESLLGPYVSALATADRQAAIKVLDNLPAEFQHSCAGAIIGSVRSNGGAPAVFEWVKSTLSSPSAASAPWAGPVFEQAVSQIVGIRQGAVLCAAFLEDVAGEKYASMSVAPNVAHRYAQVSAIEALEWSSRMSGKQSSDSPSLTVAALQGTSEGELNKAAEWCVKNLTGTTREAAVTTLLSRSATLDAGVRAELETLAPHKSP